MTSTMINDVKVNYWNHEMDVIIDGKLLFGWVIMFAITIPLLQKLFLWPLAKKLFTLQSGAKDSKQSSYMKQWKFVVAATKLLSYILFLTISGIVIIKESSWFWNPSIYHFGANSTIPSAVKGIYFMETAYYIYTLFAMFWEPRMKDRLQMVFHHIFTITLLSTSYAWNQYRYGFPIMVLHDFSDPWMEAAKLFNYLQIDLGANLCFSVFALSFFYLRDYIFMRYIIYSTYIYCRPTGAPYYWITFASLFGLWILHLIWSTMIYRVFHENVIKGNAKGDVREDE